jgi:diaminopimelate epimerase
MQTLRFTKMEGAGNDYVYVDAFHEPFDLERGSEVARIVADRRFGIGGDGLIVLAESTSADVRMVMWNADGSRGSMCGNGVRCVAKLAHDVGVVKGSSMRVETDCGVKLATLRIDDHGEVTGASVDMGEISVDDSAGVADIGGRTWRFHPADAGNPHAVVFLDEDPAGVPVLEIGAAMQKLAVFPDGVNVEFVSVRADGSLDQRTFERGSGETLACGSGATAAACAAVRLGKTAGPRVTVHLLGGDLVIDCGGDGAVMEGPARTVFSGEIQLPII